MRVVLTLVSGFVAITFFLSACAPAPVPTAPPPGATLLPAAAGGARDGGSIVMGGGKDDGAFNIALFPKSSCVCNNLIFSTLFKLNTTGSDVEGDLVDHWETQADGLGYTLDLRTNAVWHDGQPVTADDVVYTLDQIRNPQNGSSYIGQLGGLASYRADGTYRVQLVLNEPTPALLSRLTRVGVLPKHLLEHEPNLSASSFNQAPVGSGPFKFESYTPGVQIALVRNEQYYLGRPHLERITFRFLNDTSAATLQLKSGEIDLARLTSAEVPALAEASNVVLQQYPTNGTGGLQLNLRNPTLADQRVRQALSHALDRDAISQGVFSGIGQVEPAPIASTSPFFSSNYVAYPHDTVRALALLAEAGWQPASDGRLTRNGQPLELTMNVNSERVTSVLAAQAAQAQFKSIGVTINLRVVDFATWRDLAFNKKDFDLFWTAYGSALDPDDTEYDKNYSTAPGNLAGFSDPEIDKLLDVGRHSLDPAQRKQAYAAYQRRMTEVLPMLFIGYDRVLMGTSRRLHGLAVRPVGFDGNAFLDNAHLWWVDA